MKRLTTEQWQDLIQHQSKTQLTIAEFCKLYQLTPSSFYKHKASNNTKPKHKNSPFIKVKPTVKAQQILPTIKLEHNKTQLHLPLNIQPDWLAKFVKALA
jgi:hypothetical protein